MSGPARRVAVVGGGIAGLTAAFDLSRAGDGPAVDVTVFEASNRLGGKLHTTEFLGHPVDCGADSFLARVPDAVDLCRELELSDEIVTPAVRRAFLLHHGQLVPFPDGLVLGVPTDLDALARSGLVSDAAIERARRDLADPAPPRTEDESVGSLVRRRLGDEVFEALVAPLLSGVNAGDADRLSLEAGAVQLAAASRGGGSLIEQLRAQVASVSSEPPAPVFHSLAAGTGRLVDALVDALAASGRVDVRRSTAVDGLSRSHTGFDLSYAATTGRSGTREVEEEEVDTFDAVVVATPGFVTGPLLAPIAAEVAEGLGQLEYASVVVVSLGFDRSDIGHPLDGSGFLVPEGEGLLLTACSWGSAKWPQWADPDRVVLRLSAGRLHDQRAMDLDDDALVRRLTEEIAGPLAIAAEPLEVRVTRWDDALPQYRPGHLERAAAWDEALALAAPGLVLAGASGRGLGIPACIASGRRAAARVLDALA